MDQLTPEARFWARVAVGTPEECWPWLGPVHSQGYARAYYKGERVLGHRVSYAITHGVELDELPDFRELQLDHLCRNRICVNPNHLEMVTRRENILRGIAPAALHARKTHCPRDHPYDEANTRMWRGQRQCRACHRESEAARQRRLRSER